MRSSLSRWHHADAKFPSCTHHPFNPRQAVAFNNPRSSRDSPPSIGRYGNRERPRQHTPVPLHLHPDRVFSARRKCVRKVQRVANLCASAHRHCVRSITPSRQHRLRRDRNRSHRMQVDEHRAIVAHYYRVTQHPEIRLEACGITRRRRQLESQPGFLSHDVRRRRVKPDQRRSIGQHRSGTGALSNPGNPRIIGI